MTCGIYYIKNLIDGKIYIGQSVNIEKRWKEHIQALKSKNHRNNYLQNVYNKYGEKELEHKIILVCEKEELNEKESFYILEFNSLVPNGYNLTNGGDSQFEISSETRKKLKESKLGSKNPMFGITPSPETLEKRSKSLLGKNLGKKHSEETKSILRSYVGEKASGFGRVWKKEDIEKLSAKRIGELNPNFGKKRKNSTSKYYGVSLDGKKWRVDIKYKNKMYRLGHFKDEILAAKKYDEFIIENNFPHPLNF